VFGAGKGGAPVASLWAPSHFEGAHKKQHETRHKTKNQKISPPNLFLTEKQVRLIFYQLNLCFLFLLSVSWEKKSDFV